MTTPANPPADLVAWLRQQLDDDERVAREATPGPWKPDAAPDGRWYVDPGHDADDVGEVARHADATHIARHDPARVLADVDAKRRMLDYHAEQLAGAAYNQREGDDEYEVEYSLRLSAVEHVLRLLALPYADRPGYREEWRP